MQWLFDSTFGAIPRHRPRSRPVYESWLLVGIVYFTASATAAPDPARFQLVGSGTLALNQPIQESGNVQLKAYLTPRDVVSVTSSTVQEGGRFALAARLAAASLVCYNDTIFRNDFDGDGF